MGLLIFSERAGTEFQNLQIISENLRNKLLNKNEQAVNNTNITDEARVDIADRGF